MSFEILFFLFSSIILTSALVVISARNPIHSVLFLILVFVNVIFILIHLEVEFLALTFVIVYVGAVAVLFLFVVMMLNIKIVELNKELIHYFPIGGLIGLIFLVDVFFIIFKSDVTPLLKSMPLPVVGKAGMAVASGLFLTGICTRHIDIGSLNSESLLSLLK